MNNTLDSDNMKTFRQKAWIMLLVCGSTAIAAGTSGVNYTDYVDTKIGTGGHGHVFVGANVPFGMVQLGPTSIPQEWDFVSGYHDSDSTVIGFSHTHLSGTGIGDLFDVTLMPVVGQVTYARGKEDDPASGMWSYADRTKEVTVPGYYSVPLKRYGINAELTATERVGMHRYTFPASNDAAIVVDLQNGGCWDRPTEVSMTAEGNNRIVGYRFSKGWANDQKVFFVAEFSKPFSSFDIKDDKGMYGRVKFKTTAGERILVKVALSSVSIDGARANMSAELPAWDFDAVRQSATQAWNERLGRIHLTTADTDARKKFYTSLYHTMIMPSALSDADGQYRGADGKVHSSPYTHYSGYSLWDTYRAQMPLMAILNPDLNKDMVNDMIDIAEQQGVLPVWHLWGNETNCMVGNPGIIAVADAVAKKTPGVDLTRAYKALLTTAADTARGGKWRIDPDFGFIPSDKMKESIAFDMEYAIADAALAAAARSMGDILQDRKFTERSRSYRVYLDKSTGFARGRMSDGAWRTPFDPNAITHRLDDYCEGNAWQYTWLVPHDLDGLVDFFGGKEKTIAALDTLFTTSSVLTGEDVSPDVSGLIGQYAHGNEPSHHIIYFYTMLGQNDKAADLIRKVADDFYTTSHDGIIGNEDAGQMSAWYILSALGFYQVEPASGRFWFGTPLFEQADVTVPGGTFRVIARNISKDNRYIRGVRLNGRDYDRMYITHDDIMKGGTLEFIMGPQQARTYTSANDIIPRPASVRIDKGVFHLAKDESNVTGKVNGKGAPESYTLTVKPGKAAIVAADSAGLYYGWQTLRQMARIAGDKGIACETVTDAPRFPYRGLHFDVSRHFRPIEFIKKQLDAMARLKLNTAHLHLTDGAGWRMEVDAYPRLTEYGAWRPQRRWSDWRRNGSTYCTASTPGAYGGFYTKEQLRDLVNYAAERHITLIPEIEMPGHSDEVVAAYPEVSCSGKGGDLCPGKEATFTFLEKVLDETMEIFPSHIIHIGGDEAPKTEWKNCPDCKRRMEQEGLANVEELQSYMIKRIERYLNDHGRSIIGWDEILEGGVAPNATIMSWRGTEGGIQSMNAGHDVVMTPGEFCYIDYCQDASFSEPPSIGGYTPLDKVYSYEPLDTAISPDKAKHLKGVQANLWTEYITEDDHAEYMYYPRAYAIAEVGWSTPEKDYPDFRRRALVFNGQMKADGYNVFDLENEYGQRREAMTPVSHLARGAKVIYTTPCSRQYTAGGDGALTDGIRGGWRHGDGRWQGFNGDFEATVDLGQVRPLHYAGASFMHCEGAWIHLPQNVVISTSQDGVNFTEQTSIDACFDPHYSKIMVKEMGAPINVNARYVRFTAKRHPRRGSWIFTDELVVN